MILLDTTVLTYAVGDEHYLRDPCRRLLKAHADGLLRATTTIEVIQEFAHVRARRRSRADAVARARQYAAAFALLVTRAEDLDLGLALYLRYRQVGAFDAVLAAVALNQQVDALVSADRSFGHVPHLPWVDPSTPALNRLFTEASG